MFRACSAGLCTAAVLALVPFWADSWTRSYELERQNKSPEEGGYSLEDYTGFMKIIGNDNTLDPRGNKATLAEFGRLAAPPSSVLEVGPGSGDFARLLARTFPNATVVGIDAHALSIRAARSFGENPANLRFEHRSSVELSEPPKSFDVVTTTYVNHEIFPDAVFVDFLRRVKAVGRKAFIFNDYFRSLDCLVPSYLWFKISAHGHALAGLGIEDSLRWLGLISEEQLAELKARQAVPLAQSPAALKLASDAGYQSMRRAFSLDEYKQLFRQAGFSDSALKCTRHDRWSMERVIGATCRVTCFVDLTAASA